jgi:hypothetical protein
MSRQLDADTPEKQKNDTPSDELFEKLPPLYNDSLREIFGFTPAELNANRMGRLLSTQQDKLFGELKAEIDAMWLLLTIFLGVSALIGIIIAGGSIPTVYLMIAGGLIVGSLLFTAYMRQKKLRQDVESTRIKQTAGVPELQVAGIMNNREVKMVVNNKPLSITLDEFVQLERYDLPYLKVYYTENKMKVVSAEVLDRYIDDEKLKNDDLELAVNDIPETIIQDDHDPLVMKK